MRTGFVLLACLGVLVGGSGSAGAQETPSMAKYIWLVDDFEDQNLDGWTTPTGPCFASIAAIGADGSSYSMRIDGACGHYAGTSYDLTGLQATGLSLFVRSGGAATHHAYVVLDDDDIAANGYLIAFLATADGWFSAYAGQGHLYDLMPNDDLDWHEVYFGIDWIGRNVDIIIDGTPRQYNLPFSSDTIAALNRLHLYNFESATSWFDQIVLSGPPASIFIMADGFESADASGWSRETPTMPRRLVMYKAGGVSGAIGGRPGADVLCGQAAMGKAGVPLHATTRALLSVDVGDTIALMPILYGVPTDRMITGPNWSVIADDWADLLDGSIDMTLSAAGVMFGVWYSGSLADGTLAAETCSGWTDGSGSSGRYGFQLSTGVEWISSGSALCGNPLYDVLCLAWR